MKTYTFKIDRFEFIVNCKPEKKGIFTCHIPAYDIYFGAKNNEMIEKKAKAIVSVWLSFYKIK